MRSKSLARANREDFEEARSSESAYETPINSASTDEDNAFESPGNLESSFENSASTAFLSLSLQGIQAKLTVGSPNDDLEREADEVSEQMVQSSSADDEIIRRRPAKQGDSTSSTRLASAQQQADISSLSGTGLPMPESTRSVFSSRMGSDFSDVRIHHSPRAASVAESLDARAFTLGNEIFFGEGNWSPETQDGVKLLAHELWHVRQNSGAGKASVANAAIRRDDGDTGAEEEEEQLPTFSEPSYEREGDRFNGEYIPGEPAPNVGTFTITLWVHITYAPFTRAMMRDPAFRGHSWTQEQLGDFEWTDEEKERMSSGFMESVQSAWSSDTTGLNFHLNDPDFSEYRCNANVQVVVTDSPDLAHVRITAQKVPQGAPPPRAWVSGDMETATLFLENVEGPEGEQPQGPVAWALIGPFAYDSAELTPDLEGQIASFESQISHLVDPASAYSLLGDNYVLDLSGRASSPGSLQYNRDLGLRRAQSVEQKIFTDLGRPELPGRATSVGEPNMTAGEEFQRVDVVVQDVSDLTAALEAGEEETTTTMFQQNTAAHEAGHMFGLGDEYIEEDPSPVFGGGGTPAARFLGDRPTHYEEVESLMGTEAAEEMIVTGDESIMAGGMTVDSGHYIFFLEMLNDITGMSWRVE